MSLSSGWIIIYWYSLADCSTNSWYTFIIFFRFKPIQQTVCAYQLTLTKATTYSEYEIKKLNVHNIDCLFDVVCMALQNAKEARAREGEMKREKGIKRKMYTTSDLLKNQSNASMQIADVDQMRSMLCSRIGRIYPWMEPLPKITMVQ